MPSVIQKIVQSEPSPQKAAPRPPRPRVPSKKKKRRPAMVAAGAAGVAAAAGGAASIRDPVKGMGKHLGKSPQSIMKLLSKSKPGDVILSGNIDDLAGFSAADFKRPGERLFFQALKSGTQSYTPHGSLVYGKRKLKSEFSKHKLPTQILDVQERTTRRTGTDFGYGYDRVTLLRPKKDLTKGQQKALAAWSKKQVKGARPYATGQAVLQGALGTIVPKKIRECFIGRKTKSSFCTGLPGEAMERAGAPVVKGKGSAALSKDLISSKKLKAVGWAGSPITKLEKLKAIHAPRAIRALVYGAGAAGAAYGVAKLIGKMRAGKKAGKT